MNPAHLQDPASAPLRPDLGFLRHRRATPPIDYTKRPEPERATPPPASPPPATAPQAPAAGALDLSAPAAPPAPPAPPATPPPARTVPGGASGPGLLDLTPAPPASTPAAPPPARAGAPRRSRPRTLPHPRVAAGTPVVLAAGAPTVTLTRLQSGLGQLRMTMTAGSAAGDVAMGMACETADGVVHVLQRLGDALATPERPLPMARMEGDDALVLDLRQVGHLRRALLYAYSPSIAVIDWEALVVLTTQDGSRVEAPLDLPPLSGVVAMVTLYNVFGELVVRSEQEAFSGPPEMAAEAYGYRYGWIDGRLPSRRS